MKRTTRLFDNDAKAKEFRSLVLSCDKMGDVYKVVLDGTLFFPEEGGQTSDRGMLGGAVVSYVYEEDGIIYHECNAPLKVGDVVDGIIEYDERFRKMQNHTGEHIISGIIHRLYGFENVGFHLGNDGMTMDFSGSLTREQLAQVERLANEAVISCLPVRAYYPTLEELSHINYRSKLELTENIRIVSIGDVDSCACCAPHVSNTGEIGIIKILDFMRYKGGVRVYAVCGFDALEDYGKRYDDVSKISAKISSPRDKVSHGVEKLLDDVSSLKIKVAQRDLELRRLKLDKIQQTDGNLCIFETVEDMNQMRNFANEAVKKCGRICGVFSGDDNSGYRYVIMSRGIALREMTRDINEKLKGKGGGSDEMITGNCLSCRADIEKIFASL